jgi:hypothetical protein
MKTQKLQKLKNSGELVGKKVNISFEDNDGLICVIDTMETDGILVHYFTDSDSSSICGEEDDDAVLTQTYIPWSSLHFIDYREDGEYP